MPFTEKQLSDLLMAKLEKAAKAAGTTVAEIAQEVDAMIEEAPSVSEDIEKT